MADDENPAGDTEQAGAENWSAAVAPIVAKFEVAAALDLTASWNATGARAVGQLMKEMARRLDEDAIEAIRVRDEVIERITAKNQRLMEIGRDALAGIKTRDAEVSRLRKIVQALGEDPDKEIADDDADPSPPSAQ